MPKRNKEQAKTPCKKSKSCLTLHAESMEGLMDIRERIDRLIALTEALIEEAATQEDTESDTESSGM